jgi:hypothetical protein
MNLSNITFLSRGVLPHIEISNRHIRVHCIDFELDNDRLPPLIYVEDLSTNGTFLTMSSDEHDKPARKLELYRPFLVNNGDQIRLGNNVNCVFECFSNETPRTLTESQIAESKVNLRATSLTKLILKAFL